MLRFQARFDIRLVENPGAGPSCSSARPLLFAVISKSMMSVRIETGEEGDLQSYE